MKKVGIVSCDKYKGKIEEDKNLKEALINLGINTDIISWQSEEDLDYDLLVIRSVWGYQNNYNEFKNWLLNLKEKNIRVCNSPDIILDNIRKDRQFNILKRNNIDCIETVFLDRNGFSKEKIKELSKDKPTVIKPSISGSGENTHIINIDLPNSIKIGEVEEIYGKALSNSETAIMIQPYISEINNGEYSCIFIEGKLTHTMMRFPNIFHDKKEAFLVENVPSKILELARKVESLEEYKGYLYMRVDMVMVNDKPKIMEVELAEPDLLTRKIKDEEVKTDVITTFAKKIKNRIGRF